MIELCEALRRRARYEAQTQLQEKEAAKEAEEQKIAAEVRAAEAAWDKA